MRGLLVRAYEKIMGLPHQKQHADMVRQAVSGLRHDVKSISNMLTEYQEANDPLVALMLDVFNDREAVKPYTEEHDNDHDKPSPESS